MAPAIIALTLAIWVVAAPGETTGLTTNEATYMILKNGNYDNQDQFQADNKSHDFFQLRILPVKLSAQPDRPMVYIEYQVNEKHLQMLLCDVSEDANGMVHLVPHNFTDPSQHKLGEYSAEDLFKIQPEQLHGSPQCEGVYEVAGPGDMYGTFPDCRSFINGKPSLYASILSCDGIKFVVPRGTSEDSSIVPYNLDRKGDRYPVPDLPNGFVNPC